MAERPMRWLQRYLSRLEYPQLLMLALALLALDVVVPDPLPFLDETLLLVVSMVLALWKEEEPEKPPEKNVTPPR